MADLNTARRTVSGAGIQTSALCIGGATPSATGVTESFNGTAWTEVADLNTARASLAGMGNANNTDAVVAGGDSGPKVNVEQFDGSAWTEVADISSARFGHKGSGSSSLGFVAGGAPGPYLNATEEWTITHTLKKVTTA